MTASSIWDPLEREEAIRFGKITVEVVYRDRMPVRLTILKKEPSWGPEDVPTRTDHPLA